MTLLINSNKDFDWVKTPYLFYFRSVKFHYLKKKNTHDVSSLLVNLLVYLSTKDNETNLFHDWFVHNLKTPTRTRPNEQKQ